MRFIIVLLVYVSSALLTQSSNAASERFWFEKERIASIDLVVRGDVGRLYFRTDDDVTVFININSDIVVILDWDLGFPGGLSAPVISNGDFGAELGSAIVYFSSERDVFEFTNQIKTARQILESNIRNLYGI